MKDLRGSSELELDSTAQNVNTLARTVTLEFVSTSLLWSKPDKHHFKRSPRSFGE